MKRCTEQFELPKDIDCQRKSYLIHICKKSIVAVATCKKITKRFRFIPLVDDVNETKERKIYYIFCKDLALKKNTSQCRAFGVDFIDLIVFNAVSAVLQPYNGRSD